MTIALVQQKSNPVTAGQEFTSTTSAAVTLTSTPTQNNLVVCAGYDTAVSPTFTATNGYTIAKTYNGTQAIGGVYIGYKVAGASESSTVTVTQTNGTGSIWAAEFSGLKTSSVLDQVGQNQLTSNGTSMTVTTDAAIAQSDELVIFAGLVGGPDSGNWTVTSFTDGYQALSGVEDYRILTSGAGSTTSAAASWPGSLKAVGVIATFKGLASGRPKVNVASVWTTKPLKMYSGGTWNEKPVKKYNGSSWVALS